MRKALEQIPELSLLEEQLAARLCALSLQRGYAWPSQDELARLLRCTVRTVISATKRLCGLGLFITVRTAEGLNYLPQWGALGLEGVDNRERPEKFAGRDLQILPMHYRSTTPINDQEAEPPLPVDSPRGDPDPAADEVAQSDLKPDNPRAPQGASSSSTSHTRPELSGLEREASRGALNSGPRRAPAAVLPPVQLEQLKARFSEGQLLALHRELCDAKWRSRPDVITIALGTLLERKGVRAPDGYVRTLYAESLELADALAVRAERAPPARAAPPTSDHPDDVQISTLKRRIRESPAHPRRPQYERELAELEQRRLGARAAS